MFEKHHGLFLQTPMKDPKTGEMKDKVTAFIVERGFGGVSRYYYLLRSSCGYYYPVYRL